VLQSGRLRLSGFLAWVTWMAVHLEFLAQSSLRVSVFVRWAPLRDPLLTHGDHCMHLADLTSYLEADARLCDA
jgi:hypothetical protein